MRYLAWLVDRGGDPIGRRKGDRPEGRCRAVEFEGDFVELQAVIFDAHDAAAHFHVVARIVEQEGLADMQMLRHAQEPAMSIDDMSFSADLNLFAMLIFREHGDSDTKDYAFAAAAIGLFVHLCRSRLHLLYAAGMCRQLYGKPVVGLASGEALGLI